MRGLGLGLGMKLRRGYSAPQPELIYDRVNLATGWSTINTTIGVSAENDPESGQVASDVFETVTDASHYVHANVSFVQGATYRIRVVVKGNQRTVLTLLVADTPTKLWYGTIGTTTALLSSGTSNPTVTDLGSGWYAHEIEFTLTTTDGAKNVRIGIALDPLDTTYPGDVTKGIRVGSVKIYRLP